MRERGDKKLECPVSLIGAAPDERHWRDKTGNASHSISFRGLLSKLHDMIYLLEMDTSTQASTFGSSNPD